LSLQRTSIAPRFWIAFNRFTITLCRDIAIAPRARLAVTTIGSISGVRPTATAIAKRKASFQSPLTNPFSRKTTGTMTNMNRISTQVTRLTPLSKLVSAR
jgi:hypothetical protein